MKKVFLSLICIMLIFASACGINIEKLDNQETYPAFSGSLEKIYTSLEQLEQDADIIAEISVSAQETVSLNGFPQTHSQVRLMTILKGDAVKGDLLTVIEEGCNTEEQKLTVGVPPMDQDEAYILHLTEYDGKYYILGAFQGKFIIKDGYVFQQSTEDVKMTAYSPLPIDEFKNLFS